MRTHLGRGICLITYHPAWARGVRELERHQYQNGEGTVEQRVAYADQQGGYHDMRVTICLANGLTVDQIDPCTGHALVPMEDELTSEPCELGETVVTLPLFEVTA